MLDNVRTITFDQCQLGLISPGGSPLRKRTRIATNSKIMAEKLCGKLCSGEHIHMRVTGSELNIVLSRHAQKYPPGLVAAIAEAAVGHVCLAPESINDCSTSKENALNRNQLGSKLACCHQAESDTS